MPSTEDNQEVQASLCHQFSFGPHVNSTYSYWDRAYAEFSTKAPTDLVNPFSFGESDIILDSSWLTMCGQFIKDALGKEPVGLYVDCSSTDIDLTPEAMRRLKKSYERFLYMAAKYPLKDGTGFIPPTYAIDIIWHSYMQEPLNYTTDCLRLVGYVIFHCPWPVIEGHNMKTACRQTDQIWKDEFDSEVTTDHLQDEYDLFFTWEANASDTAFS